MKKQLRLLVVYREAVSKVKSQPSIEDNKNLLPEKLAKEILDYLTSPEYLYMQFPEDIENIYDGDLIPQAFYADGTYCWSELLIHWIKKYKINLPEEFLQYFEKVKNNKPKGNIDFSRYTKKSKRIFLEKPRSYFN